MEIVYVTTNPSNELFLLVEVLGKVLQCDVIPYDSFGTEEDAEEIIEALKECNPALLLISLHPVLLSDQALNMISRVWRDTFPGIPIIALMGYRERAFSFLEKYGIGRLNIDEHDTPFTCLVSEIKKVLALT